jgi:cyclopropane fatty-acyl-phospholipid synthase-like methyltransferase
MGFIRDIETLIQVSGEERETLLLCSYLAKAASLYHSGRYISEVAEQALCRIAARYPSPPGVIQPGSFLHVMTQAADAGGHTRVVERWVAFAPDDEMHAVVMTGQSDFPVPDAISRAVSGKHGEVTLLQHRDPVQRALALRNLASGFHCIVLHAHMYDVVPVLAFGTEAFTRPVILFNHADFLFWLGVSVSDLVLDISTRGQEITRTKRGITDSVILPVPIPCPDRTMTKAEARQSAGLPQEKKIILSIGSAFKYTADSRFDFAAAACSLVEGRDNRLFIVIGPDQSTPAWQSAFERTQGKVIALGKIPRTRLDAYYRSADLYLESFPIGGGTAMLEAIAFGIPSYSVRGSLSEFDLFAEHKIRLEDLPEVAHRILDLGEPAGVNPDKVRRQHCREGWAERLHDIISMLPQRHTLHLRPGVQNPISDEHDDHLVGQDLNFINYRLYDPGLFRQLPVRTRNALLNSLLDHEMPVDPSEHRQISSDLEQGAAPLEPGAGSRTDPIQGTIDLEALRKDRERLIASQPDHSEAHHDLGIIYSRRGDIDKALLHFEQAVRLAPENVAFLKNLADFQFGIRKQLPEAISLYRRLLARTPQDIETMLILGNALAGYGDVAAALAQYERVLDLDPVNTNALKNISCLLQEKRVTLAAQIDRIRQRVETAQLTTLCSAAAGRFGVAPQVHPDDHIFRFLVQNTSRFKSVQDAIENYFSDGAESASRLLSILARLGYDALSIRLLEFASGYGMVTRHLLKKLPGQALTCCDIHQNAVRFLSDSLGVHSVASDSVPERAAPGNDFDCVFALSFFSHMPRSTWTRWVKALLAGLKPGGHLIFTTHGEKSRQYFGNPRIDPDGFWFSPQSEQKDLDTAEYGQTIVTREFVLKETLGLDAEMVRAEEAAWWGHQDLYIMRKTSPSAGTASDREQAMLDLDNLSAAEVAEQADRYYYHADEPALALPLYLRARDQNDQDIDTVLSLVSLYASMGKKNLAAQHLPSVHKIVSNSIWPGWYNRVLTNPEWFQGQLRALIAALRSPSGVSYSSLAQFDDVFWFWMNTLGYRKYPELRNLLPGLPDSKIQTNLTGAAGDNSMLHGYGQYSIFRKLIAKHMKKGASLRSMLDFGCGYGRILRFFIRDFPEAELHGLDINEDYVKWCSENIRYGKFAQSGVWPPTIYSDSKFDAICSFSVFSHLNEENGTAWLKELNRICSTDGLVIVTIWSHPNRTRDYHAPYFPDYDGLIKDYDSGKFCFTGRHYPKDWVYAEALIPPSYIINVWSRYLTILDIVEGHSLSPNQSYVVMGKLKT